MTFALFVSAVRFGSVVVVVVGGVAVGDDDDGSSLMSSSSGCLMSVNKSESVRLGGVGGSESASCENELDLNSVAEI